MASSSDMLLPARNKRGISNRLVSVIAMVVVLAALTFGGWVFVYSLSSTCHYEQRQWDALHKVIEVALTPPRNVPLTAAQQQYVSDLKGRMETAQGDRPAC